MSERNYLAYKLEFLTLKWAVTDQFHEYLYEGNFDAYTDNNPLTYIFIPAKLDAVGQCWVLALANYNFQPHYKTGKSKVEADALSHIPLQQARLECLDLKCLTVKVIITCCTAETSLFEAYSGKTVIPPHSETLFLGKVEVDKTLPLLIQEWREQQRQDKTISEIKDLLQNKKLNQQKDIMMIL